MWSKNLIKVLIVSLIFTIPIQLPSDPVFQSNTKINLESLPVDQQVAALVPEELQKVVLAMIHIESRGNPNAQSKCKRYVGILQISPIYVKEVNNILGTEQYELNDRFSSVKSLEMFMVMQKHWNPDFNVDRAIYLHNKSKAYHKKVMTIYNRS